MFIVSGHSKKVGVVVGIVGLTIIITTIFGIATGGITFSKLPEANPSIPAPVPVYTIADNLFNVRSYYNYAQGIAWDGYAWDDIILINPKIIGELIEIPDINFTDGMVHFFFHDTLQKAGRVYRGKADITIYEKDEKGDEIRRVDKSKNSIHSQYKKVDGFFYFVDPKIEPNGGCRILIPDNMLSGSSEPGKIYFIYRDQLELISW